MNPVGATSQGREKEADVGFTPEDEEIFSRGHFVGFTFSSPLILAIENRF